MQHLFYQPYSGRAGVPWYDVHMYGAVGDGTVNDAAAIQAAIDAAAAASPGGGVVLLRNKNYNIGTTTLALKLGVRLIGHSRFGTRITYTGTGAAVSIGPTVSYAGMESLMILTTSSNANVRGLSIGTAVYSATIRNVLLMGNNGSGSPAATGQIGIVMDGGASGSYWNVFDDVIIFAFDTCISLLTTGADQANANLFSNIRLYAFGAGKGILVTSCHDNTFVNIQADLFASGTALELAGTAGRNIITIKAEGGASSVAVVLGASTTDNMLTVDDQCPNASTFGGTNNTIRYNGYYLGNLRHLATSPTQLTGNVNDYNPGEGTFFRLSSDASRNITGIAAGLIPNGRRMVLANVGAQNIVLQNQNAGSAAANRIITGLAADFTLAADKVCELIYDATTTRWRLFKNA